MGSSERDLDRVRDGHLRRQAAQLLCALPEETSEARRVLRYALELLDTWIECEPDDGPGPDRVDGERIVSLSRHRSLLGSAFVAGLAIAACWGLCLSRPAVLGLQARYAIHQLGGHTPLRSAVDPIERNAC